MSDLGPWSDCAELDSVFAIETFEDQVRALLDLRPKASAKNLLELPWEEPHKKAEFQRLRDAWALDRASKREEAREYEEKPLDVDLWDRVQANIRSGDMKAAKEAYDLMGQIASAKQVRASHTQDDFTKLSDVEVLVLGALLHKLRDEPMTQFDENAIAYIGALEMP